jgi:hypothetical protein
MHGFPEHPLDIRIQGHRGAHEVIMMLVIVLSRF